MRSLALPVLGLGLLVSAVLLQPLPSEREGRSLLQALGQSLGGGRVLVSDVLFLRAARLRREGRIEEVAPLYERILEFEPDNPAAAEFLAGVMGYDLVGEAPDPNARFRRWEAAWNLIRQARSDHPHDASLLVRAADLLLDVPATWPDLEARVERVVGDRRLAGLRLLLDAARLEEVLPRRGRHHLVLLSEGVPVVALDRLGEARDRVLRIGDDVLRARGAALAGMRWVGSRDGGDTLVAVPRDILLREGMAAVRDALEGDPEDLPRVAARWRALAPGSALAERLDARLR